MEEINLSSCKNLFDKWLMFIYLVVKVNFPNG